MAYMESLNGGSDDDTPPDSEPDKRVDPKRGKPADSSGSFLLDYWRSPDDDEANHVIVRNEHGMILLNKYPYTNGHLLIALGDARPTLSDYEPAQRGELWVLVERAVALCEKALEPQGLNIGINQGIAGGAGVPSHLHVHVMPRWVGDTNFISAVGGVRVIPSALEMMYERYTYALKD
jgi:ATP adenylyltransferase